LSRKIAARVTLGAISLSSSSHLAASAYSKMTKLVALPPGRAMLTTSPEPTGSMTLTNTIGTVVVKTPPFPVAGFSFGVVLLNDLISPREQRGRHIEPEGLRGLQVDHQLVFGRRLHLGGRRSRL
jgi:hypothetical protein